MTLFPQVSGFDNRAPIYKEGPMAGTSGWLSRTGAVILFMVAVVAALYIAIWLPYFLALWIVSIPLLTVISIAAFFAIAWAASRVSALLWCAARGPRFAVQAGAMLTLAFAASLYWLVLKPSPDPGAPPPFENTRYWKLATGSRIAYSEIDPPAGMSVNPSPVVYLHGGPGVRQGPFDQAIYGSLSREGFRVFLYDQAGSGLSDFLPHVRDYTFKRMVDDLEAIRQQIGADKMVLIGHSWGSTLAASYMAKYPGHVAKVIFHSPADIWDWKDPPDYSRTDSPGFTAFFPGVRMMAAIMLADRNPDAAESLVSQREMEGLFIPELDAELGTIVCKGHSDHLPPEVASMHAAHENPAMNPYVQRNLQFDNGDPHEALRKDPTPAILMYPECNYVPWAGAVDYRKTLPNLKIFYIPHAAHYIQLEQSELMRRIMVAFLLDQPDVIAPLEGDADPRLSKR
jgi:pimeloyl-ACP methyl ester carboxylesterase